MDEENYIATYDAEIYVVMALAIASFCWTKPIEVLEATLLPKYVQYIVGGSIYVLDRISEAAHYEMYE